MALLISLLEISIGQCGQIGRFATVRATFESHERLRFGPKLGSFRSGVLYFGPKLSNLMMDLRWAILARIGRLFPLKHLVTLFGDRALAKQKCITKSTLSRINFNLDLFSSSSSPPPSTTSTSFCLDFRLRKATREKSLVGPDWAISHRLGYF